MKNALVIIAAILITFQVISCRDTKKETVVKETTTVVEEKEDKGVLERAAEKADDEINEEIDEEIENIGDDN